MITNDSASRLEVELKLKRVGNTCVEKELPCTDKSHRNTRSRIKYRYSLSFNSLGNGSSCRSPSIMETMDAPAVPAATSSSATSRAVGPAMAARMERAGERTSLNRRASAGARGMRRATEHRVSADIPRAGQPRKDYVPRPPPGAEPPILSCWETGGRVRGQLWRASPVTGGSCRRGARCPARYNRCLRKAGGCDV